MYIPMHASKQASKRQSIPAAGSLSVASISKSRSGAQSRDHLLFCVTCLAAALHQRLSLLVASHEQKGVVCMANLPQPQHRSLVSCISFMLLAIGNPVIQLRQSGPCRAARPV
jgi:hypothetical protein